MLVKVFTSLLRVLNTHLTSGGHHQEALSQHPPLFCHRVLSIRLFNRTLASNEKVCGLLLSSLLRNSTSIGARSSKSSTSSRELAFEFELPTWS
jgi:hypothetical protein